MARQNEVISIQDYLNRGRYEEINNNQDLTAEDVSLILAHASDECDKIISDESNNKINENLIQLIEDKVIVFLTYELRGEERNRQPLVRRDKDEWSKAYNKELATPLEQIKNLGRAYKVLAKCYNINEDVDKALQYFSKADSCDVSCDEELKLLSINEPTPTLNGIVEKAKEIKCEVYTECREVYNIREEAIAGFVDEAIENYANNITDNILQTKAGDRLFDDVRANLKTMFYTYLNSEVNGKSAKPLSSNLVNACEKLLKELFYAPYAEYLDDKKKNPSNSKFEGDIIDENEIEKLCIRLKNNKIPKRRNTSFKSFGNEFTMGNFPRLIIKKDENTGEDVVDPAFYNFITHHYNIDKTRFDENYFMELADFIQCFAKFPRNVSSHGSTVEKPAFMHVCEEVLLKKDSRIREIMEMCNCNYLKQEDTEAQDDDIIETDYLSRPPENLPFPEYMIVQQGYLFDIKSFIPELQSFIERNNGRYPKGRYSKGLYPGDLYLGGRYPTGNSPDQREIDLERKVFTLRHHSRLFPQKDIKLLDKIGFIWSEETEMFNEAYSDMEQYKNEYGNLHIPLSYITKDGRALGRYVNKLRGGHMKSSIVHVAEGLTGEQIKKLNELGFVWHIGVEWFDNLYRDLLDYRYRAGSFENVINDDVLGPQVKDFVKAYQAKERKEYTKYKITREMIKRLEEIGFDLSYFNKIEYDNEDENNIFKQLLKRTFNTGDIELINSHKQFITETQFNNLMETTIEELDLSANLIKYLKQAGINTIEDLIRQTEEDLGKIKHVGKKFHRDIINKIHSIGLEFCPEDKSRARWIKELKSRMCGIKLKKDINEIPEEYREAQAIGAAVLAERELRQSSRAGVLNRVPTKLNVVADKPALPKVKISKQEINEMNDKQLLKVISEDVSIIESLDEDFIIKYRKELLKIISANSTLDVDKRLELIELINNPQINTL